MTKTLLALLFSFNILTTYALATPQKQPRGVVAVHNLAYSFCSKPITPLEGLDILLFPERDHASDTTRKILVDFLLEQPENIDPENTVLIMEHLPEEKFGPEITEMSKELRKYLKRLDAGFSNYDGKAFTYGYKGLVETSLSLGIPVIPLEHSLSLLKHEHTSHGVNRMEILTWRAYQVAQRFPGKKQIWLFGHKHFIALEEYGRVPGIYNLFANPGAKFVL